MAGLSTPLVGDQVAMNVPQGWKRGKRWGGLIQDHCKNDKMCTV